MIIPKPDGYELVMIGSIKRPNYKIEKVENEPTRGRFLWKFTKWLKVRESIFGYENRKNRRNAHFNVERPFPYISYMRKERSMCGAPIAWSLRLYQPFRVTSAIRRQKKR